MKTIILPKDISMWIPRTDIHKSFAKGNKVYCKVATNSSGGISLLLQAKKGAIYIEQLDFDSIEEAREEGWKI